MKKIVGLTIAVLVIIATVGVGTYAYFSDTESSTNNVLTAGTLDLNIDGGDVAVTTFSASAVAPGDSGSGSSTLANVGSMSGELDIATSAVTNTPGVGGEFGGGSGELGSSAQIAMYLDVDQSGAWNAGDIGLKSDGTTYSSPTALDYDVIDNYASETWDAVETMNTSAADDIVVNWQVPTTADNTIQGDSVSIDITFTLEQAAAD
jgi:spore coat-associated protein N